MDELKKKESKLRREASRKSALEPASSPSKDDANGISVKRKERKARKGSGPESRSLGGLFGVIDDIGAGAPQLRAQLWEIAPPVAAVCHACC